MEEQRQFERTRSHSRQCGQQGYRLADGKNKSSPARIIVLSFKVAQYLLNDIKRPAKEFQNDSFMARML